MPINYAIRRNSDGKYMSQGPWGETTWVKDIMEAYPWEMNKASALSSRLGNCEFVPIIKIERPTDNGT